MELERNNSVNFSYTKLDISLENYDISIKVTFAIIGIIFIFFSTVALVALNKTRQTPSTARFLSSGLITFDILAIFCYTVRKFVENHGLNILIQVIGTGFCFLAYITVGVMSLERLIIFYSPHFYLRRITPKIVKKSVSIVWTFIFFVYYFVRFGACYIAYPRFSMYDVVGKCNTVSFSFYGVFIIGVVVISLACYVKIFMIVKYDKQYTDGPQTLSATAKCLQNYKSTSLVFVYILTIVLTSLAYAIIISTNLSTVTLRLANDVINMFNCMMDPCMYILWYGECRLEMLKMIACFTPSLSSHIEQMRLKIFDIVTIEKIQELRSNKVFPLSCSKDLTEKF